MKKMIAAAAILMASAPAMAQDSGWYVGGAFGQSKAKNFCGQFPAGTSCDDTEVMVKAIGGYQLTRNFALEVGLTAAGSFEANGPLGRTTLDIGIAEGTGVAILPLGSQFSVFGKLGVYTSAVDTQTDRLIGSSSDSRRNSDLTYGVGVGFAIAPKLVLRAEWQRYQDLEAANFGKSDLDIMSLGLVYRFY